MSRTHDTGTLGATDAETVDLPHATTRERILALRAGLSAALGSVLAVVPHVLHHIGILAGAAIITGAAGNLLFGAAGLVLSIPLLRRLYHRFGTWKAPAVAVVVFAAMFSLSAFVIGPAISGSGSSDSPAPTNPPAGHSGHHG